MTHPPPSPTGSPLRLSRSGVFSSFNYIPVNRRSIGYGSIEPISPRAFGKKTNYFIPDTKREYIRKSRIPFCDYDTSSESIDDEDIDIEAIGNKMVQSPLKIPRVPSKESPSQSPAVKPRPAPLNIPQPRKTRPSPLPVPQHYQSLHGISASGSPNLQFNQLKARDSLATIPTEEIQNTIEKEAHPNEESRLHRKRSESPIAPVAKARHRQQSPIKASVSHSINKPLTLPNNLHNNGSTKTKTDQTPASKVPTVPENDTNDNHSKPEQSQKTDKSPKAPADQNLELQSKNSPKVKLEVNVEKSTTKEGEVQRLRKSKSSSKAKFNIDTTENSNNDGEVQRLRNSRSSSKTKFELAKEDTNGESPSNSKINRSEDQTDSSSAKGRHRVSVGVTGSKPVFDLPNLPPTGDGKTKKRIKRSHSDGFDIIKRISDKSDFTNPTNQSTNKQEKPEVIVVAPPESEKKEKRRRKKSKAPSPGDVPKEEAKHNPRHKIESSKSTLTLPKRLSLDN